MSAPFFFLEDPVLNNGVLHFDELTSHHAIVVLRMKKGDQLVLTDGKGNLYHSTLEGDHKKRAVAIIDKHEFVESSERQSTIAISLLKNASRFEWFLEKSAELGINRIWPLLCDRTERAHFRMDRMRNVLISALIQSQQSWLPELLEPAAIQDLDWEDISTCSLYIAHCENVPKPAFSELCWNDSKNKKLIFIGPEGDFTQEEIQFVSSKGAIAVSLGETRLRTETAGITAAVILQQYL